ncbi:ABC transporter substrate-binding protein [Geobacter pelophilus]|uniref:ABC transporter substrate-binding protein n=1 Tax=Geoanaerobacter pelophilus TaxID=60036 RepID=A0AAW4L9W4_9BACT|nr:ABC transporter substrate-binding protein [Geoanaerobacter pelophilus]MBT0665858.1 ABC transporter substrate-binding protein [Geoanaerobacter pelophilus]
MTPLRLLLSIVAAFFFIAATAMAADAPTTVRIAYPQAGTNISAQVGMVLEKTDILKKNGFAPEMFAMSNGRDMKLALVSDKVDIIMTSEANFVVLLAEGFESYGIASLGEGGNMALTVKTNSGIERPDQLRGKTVGTIFGTSLHRPAIEWTEGVTGVKIISMPNIGALVAALESNKIDAAMLWDPHLTDGVTKGSFRVLRQEPLELIAISSKKFAERNPGALERFQKGFKEAVFYFVTNKQQVNKWYSEVSKVDYKLIDKVSRINRNYDKKRLEKIDIRISPTFIDKMKKTGAFLQAHKITTKNPAIESAVRNPK